MAQHYIVGEKGPEELTMFPNGTGWVTPNNRLPQLSRLTALHRAAGGAVQGPEIQPQGPVLPSAGGSGSGNGQGGPEVGTLLAPDCKPIPAS